MKYGLLTYDENERFFNVGDNIQSLAAKQFLPKVDEFINREELAEHKGDAVNLIMNGWFSHNISCPPQLSWHRSTVATSGFFRKRKWSFWAESIHNWAASLLRSSSRQNHKMICEYQSSNLVYRHSPLVRLQESGHKKGRPKPPCNL